MRRTLADLTPTTEQAAAYERRMLDAAPEFRVSGLQEFYDRGLLRDVVRQLKSGKEATVYIAVGDHGPIAVKVYDDIESRSFRNDATYRTGRFVGDARLERAMAHGSRRGLAARLTLWVEHEFHELEFLHDAGVRVPRPLGQAGPCIAMEFIGDGDEPAPRLSEAALTAAEARSALAQSEQILGRIVACGRVHGDYSAFNLLWWNGDVYVIDLPQLVRIAEHPHAHDLLARDIASLSSTFSRFDIEIDRAAVARRVMAAAREGLRRTIGVRDAELLERRVLR